MSPHAVNNFVSDLVEMAKAMEELPQVRKELAQADRMLNELSQTVQQRELHILDLKAEIEAKNQAIRELEVAKDAAETMFLEADDRTSRALEFVKTMFGSAGSLIQALEPAKPTLVEPPQVASSHEALAQTTAAPSTAYTSDGIVSPGETSWASHDAPPVPEVTAQPDPIARPIQHASSEIAGTAETTDGVRTHTDNPGPYHCRRYIDVPGWISRSDWLAGGGTNESYDFRY